ncbi:hypothetical protein AB205_0177650 [Aquarana catesbeiana]|uniref:Uncharacterized protein n=1 Tax=Aquarana catesbeiana TaxID=8400 RepID=A0A2G9QHE8_AQUCT|nr:hypothetical protein AB205_0177650 [Aquarana catesbeiana]
MGSSLIDFCLLSMAECYQRCKTQNSSKYPETEGKTEFAPCTGEGHLGGRECTQCASRASADRYYTHQVL